MASQGATLQNYNNELVKCIEDLREKREEVNRQILKVRMFGKAFALKAFAGTGRRRQSENSEGVIHPNRPSSEDQW